MSLKSTYGQKKGNYALKMRIATIAVTTACIVLTIICLFPILILFINSTKNNYEIATSRSFAKLFTPGTQLGINFRHLILGQLPTVDAKSYQNFKLFYGYRNSLVITVASTFLTVFFACLTAYGIQIYEFRFKEVAFTLILAVMMIPSQVTGGGLLDMMLAWHWTNSWWPLIIPAAAPPAVVFFMRSYMKSSFPAEIVEASRIDGSSEFGTFIRIALPMMKPAIAVQAIFAFITKWNDYYTPSMLIFQINPKIITLPQMVSTLTGGNQPNQGVINLGIALSLLPLMIAYILLSKFIIAGVALGGVKE